VDTVQKGEKRTLKEAFLAKEEIEIASPKVNIVEPESSNRGHSIDEYWRGETMRVDTNITRTKASSVLLETVRIGVERKADYLTRIEANITRENASKIRKLIGVIPTRMNPTGPNTDLVTHIWTSSTNRL
jgi:hypothetical protein